jgi:hypothetical protein
LLYSPALLIGFKAYVMIQLPVIWLAGFFGIWLFYVQHQFENNYWERNEKWNYVASALLGASFYKLPKVLDWFSGSIGYHHIHHLSPRIPNYNLAPAHENTPEITNSCASSPSPRASARSISKFGMNPNRRWKAFQMATNDTVMCGRNQSSKAKVPGSKRHLGVLFRSKETGCLFDQYLETASTRTHTA